MPSIRKTRPISLGVISEKVAKAALSKHDFGLNRLESWSSDYVFTQVELKEARFFENIYGYSYRDILVSIGKWCLYIYKENRTYSIDEIYHSYIDCISLADKEPVKLLKDLWQNTNEYEWVFKGYVYEVKGFYSDDEVKLLILDNFDKERRYFEKLSAKFNQSENIDSNYERPRIPENVRVEVWRRDSGRCARCGSREKLEYDHIVPISRGGSNTARNIELLCEKCNRSKSNNVV